jgi:hypothetical protein
MRRVHQAINAIQVHAAKVATVMILLTDLYPLVALAAGHAELSAAP